MSAPTQRRIFTGTTGPAREVGADIAVTLRLARLPQPSRPPEPTEAPQPEPPPPPPECPQPHAYWSSVISAGPAYSVDAWIEEMLQPWDFVEQGYTDARIDLTIRDIDATPQSVWLLATAAHAPADISWQIEYVVGAERGTYDSTRISLGASMAAIGIAGIRYEDGLPLYPQRIEARAVANIDGEPRETAWLVVNLIYETSGY